MHDVIEADNAVVVKHWGKADDTCGTDIDGAISDSDGLCGAWGNGGTVNTLYSKGIAIAIGIVR